MNYFDDNQGIEKEIPADVEIFWRPTVYAVIIRDDSILMVRPHHGLYAFPGGGMDMGESVKEALHREVLEETGYKVKSSEFYDLAERYLHIEKDDRFYHVVAMMHQVEIVEGKEGTPKSVIDGEVKSVEWVRFLDVSESNCHFLFWPTIRKIRSC